MIEIYVDGSCRKENNGGIGICAIIEDKSVKEGFRIDYIYSEQFKNTTNNRMEITALLNALELSQTKYKNKKCIIKSDSAYCVNMFNEWITNWYHNNWTRYKNQYIENLDLVKQLWEYRKIEWPNFIVEKVPGHAGLIGNEITDLLAKNQLNKLANIFKDNDIIHNFLENIDLK